MFPRSAVAGTILLLVSLAADGAEQRANPLEPLVAHVSQHRDGRAVWSIDFSLHAKPGRELPIGVFDSGIGGLTVMESILTLDRFNNDDLKLGADGIPDFAGERFIYFGDQANMPYGNYPSQHREGFLRELILKDAIFLLGTRWRRAAKSPAEFSKPPVKAIVIACNTATAYGIDDIRAALATWKLEVPVIGVIEAGARAVAEALPDDGKPHSVAVLATVGTCATGAYPKAINRVMGQRGRAALPVVQQGSLGLAGAIEGNPAFTADGKSVANYARDDVRTLAETHRRAGGTPIDTVVLGCTHFPLARAEIGAAFESARSYRDADGAEPYAAAVAKELRFIDPAEASAQELFREVARKRLRAGRGSKVAPAARFYFSVANPDAPGVVLATDSSLDAGYKSSREPGHLEQEDTVVVPLTPDRLPGASARLVQALPAVWSEMQKPAVAGP